VVTCPVCGRENPEGFRLCGYCGAVLAPSAARETRKTVTILFTDVTGSTTLGERLDPESLRQVMTRYFASMREVIEHHGGTVEKYIGDAVMAVFGVPVVHEEDALRAVRAAVEMRSALERLNVRLLEESGVALQARTGINTGPVVVAAGGPSEALVVGDAVNVAARLQTAAAPKQILIGYSTYELVRDAVEVGPAESIEVKGKSEPVVAYSLSAVTVDAEGHRRRLDAPMVERDRELAALQQAFDRVSETNSSQLFTILGTAGVGKSRLVAEFLANVRGRARVLRGRCRPYGEGITYLPVAEIIRQAAGIDDTQTEEMARKRIGDLVAGMPESAAVSRGLAGLTGLDASAAQEELVWAFRRMLERLADEKPLIVLVDDVHWAEPTLLDMVESVVDLTRDSPILFVCPARPEFLDARPTWGGGRLNATTILLEPLSEGSALELIDALVPGALPPAVRARIAEGAEGNPLYVEEFVGMLIDDGALRASTDGWSVTKDLASIAVPPTIQALLSARIDRLEADERSAAERASVVGRVFEQPAVVALSPAEDRPEIPRNLSALARKELIRADRSALTPWETFRFRHMLIRDAAYERLPKSERAELHERFADWLAEALGDGRADGDEIVGYHLEQAFRYRAELGPVDARARQLADRAARLLIAAGRRAQERSDVAATVNLYGRAAKLLEPDDTTRVAILPELGRALSENGRFEDATATFAEAIQRAEATGDEVLIAHARVMQYLVDAPDPTAAEYRRIADEYSPTFERTGDLKGLCLASRLRGEAVWMEGSVAGNEVALSEALEYARRAGSHWEQATIIRQMSVDFYWGPTPVEDAIRWCDDVMARAPDDRGFEGGVAHALAHMHARLGNFELARAFAARAIEIADQSGLAHDAASLSEVAADVETLAGDHAAAEDILRNGTESLAAMNAAGSQPLFAALHALTQVDAGLPVDIESLTAMVPGSYVSTQALLNMALGAALLAAGRVDDAEPKARAAVDYFATTDMITFHANGSLVLGDILRAAGRRSEADESYRKALELYRRKGSIVSVQTAESRLAQL
jgi:class 3 adenylate cyclase/tetratricopeptide (TPR) repeat protein